MKVLLVSDMKAPQLYEHLNVERFKDIELIISAGDLKSSYLAFLTTVLRKPLIYVHGNHDEHYDKQPPLGCICIEDTVYEYGGIRFAGLGGCMEYRGGKHQYTEKAMKKKIKKNKKAFKKGFDVLVTHSPAYNLGDGEDQAHIGFKCFYDLLDTHQPKYFIHGHMHLNYKNQARILTYKDIPVINAYAYYILDLEI